MGATTRRAPARPRRRPPGRPPCPRRMRRPPAAAASPSTHPSRSPTAASRRPEDELDEGTTYRLEVETNCGTFTITLDQELAPETSASLVSLAEKGFFDGTTFHRVVPGFVIQGGDPTGTGSGGPGYSTVDAPPSTATYTQGVVAMAKTGAEAAGHVRQPVLRRHGPGHRPAARVRDRRRGDRGAGRRPRDRQARRLGRPALAAGRDRARHRLRRADRGGRGGGARRRGRRPASAPEAEHPARGRRRNAPRQRSERRRRRRRRV